MAQLGLFRCQNQVSADNAADSGMTAAAANPMGGGNGSAGRQCLAVCGGIGRRLVRKLKKQSKILRTAGGAGFRCQYDPLSYSRNFDGSCALDDEDSSHFYYTFSSRFARPLAASH